MFGDAVNILGVLGVAVVSYIIGFLWYGPVFGKLWMKLNKVSAVDIAKSKKNGMAGKFVLNFIGVFLTSFVLAKLIQAVGATTVAQGAILGFWVWLGFFASATLLGGVLWDNKPWSLFVLNGLYWLVSLKVMGALLVLWA